MEMRRVPTLGFLFSFILIATLLLSINVPSTISANFVGVTIILKADGSIEPWYAPIDVHGNVYTLTGDIQSPNRGNCLHIERSNILLEGDGYTIEGSKSGEQTSSDLAIYAGFVNNIEIRNINLKGCANAIRLQSVSNAKIHQTTINGYPQQENSEPIGISVMSCEDVTIDQNLIVENYIGILVQWSSCTITNNTILNNVGSGLTLASSSTTMSSNLVAENEIGLEIQGSDNKIQNNDIIGNKRIGILISAPDNVFVGNNIVGQNSTNAYGIQIGPYEGGNTFNRNDFENNFIHVEGGAQAYPPNLWDNDYPLGGNYWDTYVGVDNFDGVNQNQTGSDGIGDTPYQINIENVDSYPLMQPVRSNPEISNQTPTNQDYSLITLISAAIIGAIILFVVFYWRKKRKQEAYTQKTSVMGASIIAILLTLSIIIILNFASITAGTYQIVDIEMYGGALYFDEVLIGFFSSAAGLLLTWKIIARKEYQPRWTREALSAILVSLLFVVYIFTYSSYRQFELFGLLQYIQPTLVMVWTFATTLIGCALGFLIGSIVLKRFQPTMVDKLGKRSAPAYLLITSFLFLVFVGIMTGYVAGYISWVAFGNTQEAISQAYSYAAVHPPPLVYLSAWAVAGAIILPLVLYNHKVPNQTATTDLPKS